MKRGLEIVIKSLLSEVNQLCKYVLPIHIYEKLIWRIQYFIDKDFRENCEIHKSFGKLNPDKIFYVLRCDADQWGTYTMCNEFLLQFEKASEKGYIPIVDLKNYRPKLLDNGDSNSNLWELMFRQTTSISLDEVYNSKNVILGWKNGYTYNTLDTDFKWTSIERVSRNEIIRWGKVFNENIKLTPSLQDKVEIFWQNELRGRRVLGVALREVYRYTALINSDMGRGHVILKTPEESIVQVEYYMKKWDCQYVFVICDDKECTQKFKKHFKEKCILYDRRRGIYFQNGEVVKDKELVKKELPSHYERNLEYLIEVELLARCTSIWSGITSGTEAALFRNNGKYEYINIYDEGTYI